MRRFTCVLGVAIAISCGVPASTQAEESRVQPLRSAVHTYGVANASLLEQTPRPVRIPGRSCRARVCAGAAIGAGFGALFGTLAVGSSGNRTGGALFGAMLFSIIGAGFGYKACGP